MTGSWFQVPVCAGTFTVIEADETTFEICSGEGSIVGVASGEGTSCAWLGDLSMLDTGSANRTCCVSVVWRTGDCCVGGGVGGAAAAGVGCDVEEDSTAVCSATGFGVGFAGGGGAAAAAVAGPAGRRRGGAFGAAFLPDVAELISVDMVSLWRLH